MYTLVSIWVSLTLIISVRSYFSTLLFIGSNPRELISLQSQVRTELATLNEDWKELDISYRNECKKRRSKISVEELSQRQQMLSALQEEIQRIKEIQRAGFVKGYLGKQIDKMEESEVFNPAFKVCLNVFLAVIQITNSL